MRTYKRKRPQNQVIEGVQDLCRLCLGKVEEAVPIFTEDKENVCASLALRIMICVGLEVVREECLPNAICSECYKELDKYYTFRKKCEVTYQKLKSHLMAVKDREANYSAAKKAALLLEKEKEQNNNLDNINKEKNHNEINIAEGTNIILTYDKNNGMEYIKENLSFNGIAQVNPGTQDFIENSVSFTCLDNSKTDTEVIVEADGQNSDEQPNPDLTTFLSSMLIELGILQQQEDSINIVDQEMRTLELETGDGDVIILEVMEEDEDDAVEQIEQPSSPAKEIETDGVKKDVIVKYIATDFVPVKGGSNEESSGGAPCPPCPPRAACPSCPPCPECGKRFASRSVLARHRRVHSGERPFACAACGRRFAQREVMRRHELVHHERRPFACSSCPKSFTQRGALAAHVRSHAPPHARPLALHRCTACPKVFLYASGLSRHMMMHRGRVYICGACDRQFKDKSALYRHQKTVNHVNKDAAGNT